MGAELHSKGAIIPVGKWTLAGPCWCFLKSASSEQPSSGIQWSKAKSTRLQFSRRLVGYVLLELLEPKSQKQCPTKFPDTVP
eukprot:6477163-Amphidinium_carterae.1